ncbi:MAG: portal protein [Pseudomonadota bacterium]
MEQSDEEKKIAGKTIERWSELYTLRSSYDTEREEIARLFQPYSSHFLSHNAQTTPPGRNLITSHGLIVMQNVSPQVYGAMNNPTNNWFEIGPADEDLRKDPQVKAWSDLANARLRKSFTTAMSGFYWQTVQYLSTILTFGDACMYDELRAGKGRILDLTIPSHEFCIALDDDGRVVEVVRRWGEKPAEALRKFGADSLPDKVADLVETSPDSKIYFVHRAVLNGEYIPGSGKLNLSSRPVLSVTACEMERHLVRQRGYYEMPFQFAAWSRESGQSYGRGVAHNALFAARKLAMHENMVQKGAALAVDPPIGHPGGRQHQNFQKLAPGRAMAGAISRNGTQLVRPVHTYSGLPVGQAEIERAVEELRDASLFSALTVIGRTGMSDLETLEFSEQRLRQMAPWVAGIFDQFHVPKIERRYRMLRRAGQIDPPPAMMSGQPLVVRATSAFDLAHRHSEAVSARRLLDDITAATGIAPDAADTFDHDAYARIMVQGRGAPSGLIRDQDDIDAIRAARADAARAREVAELAPGAARAARDLSEVEQ